MIDQSLVIIPTYNEALNVQLMIEKLFSLYPGISILIIDDDSPDKTSFVVEALKTAFPDLYLVKREGKLGLGTAYLEGFKWALLKKYQYIVQMDCDFSHDPADVEKLLRELQIQNADLAIGSRYSNQEIRTKGWSIHRLILSFSASLFLRYFIGLPIKDALGGFKCFHRKTLEKINLNNIISKGFIFQFEVNYKVNSLGLKIIEVPIIFSERLLGTSKMNSGIIFEALKILCQLKIKKIQNKLN